MHSNNGTGEIVNHYGTRELNPVSAEMQDEFIRGERLERVEWTDKRLARIERLRLLSDPGFPFMDVSYCWGRLKDGTPVHVELPFDQLPKRWKSALIEHAKRDRVYAAGLDVFNAVSILC